jgi:hypothetical protein
VISRMLHLPGSGERSICAGVRESVRARKWSMVVVRTGIGSLPSRKFAYGFKSMEERYHVERALRVLLLPWIVGADVPDVAFEVAAGEGAAAVVHVLDVEEHGGSGGLCGGVDGVGVGDDEIGALRLAAVDFVGLGHEFAGGGAVVDGAEHDHTVAEGELGVGDGVAGTHVDGLLLEAEGAGEPVDGGEGVAIAEPRDEGGGAGFGLVAHGW